MSHSPNSNAFPRGCNGFPLGATAIPDNDNRIPHNDNRFPLNDNAFPDNDNDRGAEFPVPGSLGPENDEEFADQRGRKSPASDCFFSEMRSKDQEPSPETAKFPENSLRTGKRKRRRVCVRLPAPPRTILLILLVYLT
jgi:hypothetical protein